MSASSESMYDDAYTIQWTEPVDVANFNYVAGMVPFLFNLIQDVSVTQTDRQAGRQAGRQTDRHTDRQTDR